MCAATVVAGAVDKEGRKLAFGNVDMTGGYITKYMDTGEVYDSHGIGHPNLLY